MKKIKSRKIYILLAIVLIGVFLRFNKLGAVPSSLTWDEVALGYNAYSLSRDGTDEFGNFLPLSYLESFGDFKPPLYAYASILPVRIFGLNAFGVRFSSAFFGSLSIVVAFLLVKEILFNHKYREYIALLAGALLSISPWHINLSRAAFEANVASFFIIGGVYCLLRFLRIQQRILLLISGLLFVGSFYTFNTARIVVPLLVGIIAIVNFRVFKKYWKWVGITSIICIIVSLSYLSFMTTPQARLRYQEVNIFTDISVIERTNVDSKIAQDSGVPEVITRLIHNRRFAFFSEYMRHYLDHFNPSYLFITGDGNPKFSTQDVGILYLWEAPFIVAGALLLMKEKKGWWWIVPIWLFIGILPAATARETPHALRTQTIIPLYQLLSAYGLISIFLRFQNIKFKKVASYIYCAGIICVVLLFFSLYIHGYYVHYDREFSREWQAGYEDMVKHIHSVMDKYDHIIFTEELGRPYIYVLFYSKVEPEDFRRNSQIERDVFGFVHVRSYDKYIFTKNPAEHVHKDSGDRALYVVTPDQLPPDGTIVHMSKLVDGKPALYAYTK